MMEMEVNVVSQETTSDAELTAKIHSTTEGGLEEGGFGILVSASAPGFLVHTPTLNFNISDQKSYSERELRADTPFPILLNTCRT